MVEGQARGVQGWHEFLLDPAHHLEVTETTILWIAAQTGANIDSRASSGGVAESGRRLRSFTFDNGAPDPFGSSSTYNNTRGLRMSIWTNRWRPALRAWARPARQPRCIGGSSTGLAVVQEVRPTFDAFYATLDEDQRVTRSTGMVRRGHRG